MSIGAIALVVISGVGTSVARAAGTIYLERCAPTSCTYTPGFDDSRTNRSSLISQTSQLPAFSHGDPAWSSLVACVQRAFAPFAVTVTDVDPGVTSHFEVVVAGAPANIGQGAGVAGISPFSCGVINNGVSFAFAALTENMTALCWTVAHEAAHLFGLDHEFLRTDPMTYLSDSLEKHFSSADGVCGEFSPRACACGSDTQSSAALLLGILGRSGSGAALFVDGFSAFTSDGPSPVEYGSADRWDDSSVVVGGDPPFTMASPQTLECGTEPVLRARAAIRR